MSSGPAPAPKAKRQNSIVELILIVAVAFGLALGIQAVLIKPFRIPSKSMVPTLEVGQRVLVFRPRLSDPQRGDVLVFMPPAGADSNKCGVEKAPDQPCPEPTGGEGKQAYIKRVVGVPGDRLKVEAGRVYIDGKLQDEPFINPSANCDVCNLNDEITIPPGHFFMMGDNRGQSADSRYWGPVPEENIIGRAFATYWPPDRIGIL
ncbi:MAG: signal peptidase [Thermoleophilaceae bacterium]|nr:signal peptidase [Thermoleophilaceae bacterium]